MKHEVSGMHQVARHTSPDVAEQVIYGLKVLENSCNENSVKNNVEYHMTEVTQQRKRKLLS